MNSIFANVFLAIQQRIQNEIPDFVYIDQDLGQLKNDSPARPNVAFPCALIDFEEFYFDNISENAQLANGTVVLKLGFAPFSNSSQSTPLNYIQSALSYYDLEWTLHNTMQGWSPTDDSGYLIRKEVCTQKRYDTLRVREIRYRLTFEDYSTVNTVQKVSEPAIIEPQLDLPAH
jgi:hypothetical protein